MMLNRRGKEDVHSHNGAHTQSEHTKLAHILPKEIFSFLFILYIISVKTS